MSEDEAKQLLEEVELTGRAAWIRELANGEFVVVLKKKSYHLWSWSDWQALMQKAEQPAALAVAS